jgi:D-lyxose ketol-isomerase
MRKFIQISVLFLLLFFSTTIVFGQENKSNDPDIQIKENLYLKYKKEVTAYNKKQFDDLFLEFFTVQNDNTKTLTKDEFYTYTIKIAIYSEKLGLLYKEQKAEAEKTKQEWFDRMYQDYLNGR